MNFLKYKMIQNSKKTKLNKKFAFFYRIREDELPKTSKNKFIEEKEYETQVKKIADFEFVRII